MTTRPNFVSCYGARRILGASQLDEVECNILPRDPGYSDIANDQLDEILGLAIMTCTTH